MSKKRKNLKHTFLAGVIVVVVALVFGIGGYYVGSKHSSIPKDPSGNTAGYVIAHQAREQVNNFYKQYIEDNNKPELRPLLLRGYGSNNLVFYNSYYQHGFDPITCSSLVPTAAAITRVLPGTVATVYADISYADHSTSIIKATVLINNDGIKIDSITCPGDKGNLTPQVMM